MREEVRGRGSKGKTGRQEGRGGAKTQNHFKQKCLHEESLDTDHKHLTPESGMPPANQTITTVSCFPDTQEVLFTSYMYMYVHVHV